MPRGRPSKWACIVVCPLWLETPLRAALIVAAPHFTHVPFRIRGNVLDARAPSLRSLALRPRLIATPRLPPLKEARVLLPRHEPRPRTFASLGYVQL